MSQAPAMPVFTDALLGDTLHLSAEEFGAYCLLLFATWRNNGKAMPDDPAKLSRICRVTTRRWLERLRPVLVSFFDLSDGCWHQKRLEKEWMFCAERAAVSRANGSRGGRPKNLNNKEIAILPGSMQDTRKEPTHTHTHKKEAPPSGGAACAREIAEQMLGIWRAECGDLFGSPTKASDSRIKKCSARLRNDLGGDINNWRSLCVRIRQSPYFTEKWTPSIDWVLEPANMLKIQEGNYDDRHSNGASRKQSAHDAELAAFEFVSR